MCKCIRMQKTNIFRLSYRTDNTLARRCESGSGGYVNNRPHRFRAVHSDPEPQLQVVQILTI
jgi:hypothetical protein